MLNVVRSFNKNQKIVPMCPFLFNCVCVCAFSPNILQPLYNIFISVRIQVINLQSVFKDSLTGGKRGSWRKERFMGGKIGSGGEREVHGRKERFMGGKRGSWRKEANRTLSQAHIKFC